MGWDDALGLVTGATGLLWAALLVITKLNWASVRDQEYAEQLALVAWCVACIVIVTWALFGDL